METKIHSFESLAALDGEGIRYGVFFTGCPLRCVYCHNPDTWFDTGEVYTPVRLAEKIRRYKPYFKDKGGAVFSGGEPLLSAPFINETAKLLKKYGINYDLDTCGCVELNEEVKRAVSGAELVILDIKFPNAEDYKRYTGGDFEKVMEFFDYLEKEKKRVWVRTVIVPGINDSEEYIERYADIIRKKQCVIRYKLLGFHTMGFFKYEALGIKNPLAGAEAMDKDRLLKLQSLADRLIEK
ncbi:MAG: radical SAM protein [Clostridiales bacterium]|nr:radical SAM protein [Clostridiales bacterium]